MDKKKHLLNEMARVGFMGPLEVIVYTNDPGHIPHVHIIDSATRGKEFDTCIMLGDNKYFLHGKHNDLLNSKLRKEFADFMEQPCRFPQYQNNYEFATMMWNANNSDSYIMAQTDAEGKVLVPDYRSLEKDDNKPRLINGLNPPETEALKEIIKECVREVLKETLNEKVLKK